MSETIKVTLPRPDLGDGLQESLERHGLRAERVEDGETVELRVSFADERERLLADATLAIEDWLAASDLPLVVERGADGCILRPPGD